MTIVLVDFVKVSGPHLVQEAGGGGGGDFNKVWGPHLVSEAGGGADRTRPLAALVEDRHEHMQCSNHTQQTSKTRGSTPIGKHCVLMTTVVPQALVKWPCAENVFTKEAHRQDEILRLRGSNEKSEQCL